VQITIPFNAYEIGKPSDAQHTAKTKTSMMTYF